MEIREYNDPEYPGYFVSEEGDVYSSWKQGYRNSVTRTDHLRKLKPGTGKVGYKLVGVMDGKGNRKSVNVHRMVCETFHENPNGYRYVNHIDEDKLNNHVSNLEWCSNKQNIIHSRGKTIKVLWESTGEVFEWKGVKNFSRIMNLPETSFYYGYRNLPFKIVD